MINGLIGFVLGVWFGALLTALMSIAKEEDEKSERMHDGKEER